MFFSNHPLGVFTIGFLQASTIFLFDKKSVNLDRFFPPSLVPNPFFCLLFPPPLPYVLCEVPPSPLPVFKLAENLYRVCFLFPIPFFLMCFSFQRLFHFSENISSLVLLFFGFKDSFITLFPGQKRWAVTRASKNRPQG